MKIMHKIFCCCFSVLVKTYLLYLQDFSIYAIIVENGNTFSITSGAHVASLCRVGSRSKAGCRVYLLMRFYYGDISS